jgi:hypothetical protein
MMSALSMRATAAIAWSIFTTTGSVITGSGCECVGQGSALECRVSAAPFVYSYNPKATRSQLANSLVTFCCSPSFKFLVSWYSVTMVRVRADMSFTNQTEVHHGVQCLLGGVGAGSVHPRDGEAAECSHPFGCAVSTKKVGAVSNPVP